MDKGSIWRKWDLHVHTPYSVLNNGFGNDWDKYVKQLFQKAIELNISVIGITDYFTIDGYKRIQQEYLNNPNKLSSLFTPEEIQKIKSKVIFPNVEFRLNKLVGTNRINFHVIFSNEVSIEDIEENFLHEIDFVFDGEPQSNEEKRKLKKRNLEKLGQKLKQQHKKFQSESDIKIGMMNAVVNDEQITQILTNKTSIFKDKYFITLPCDEDLSKLSWNGQDHHTRKLFIQKSDILIATNDNTRRWALGKFNESEEEFINEFKSLKPCIGGSDSHNFNELFTKNSEKTTWIKADQSFEGLRQILFEPSQRIKLSKEEPYQKDPKNVIEEIRIIPNDNTFPKKSILFNDNLNVIVGGKSSGKSILLYNIAKTLFQDKKEHSLLRFFNPDSKKQEYKYDFGKDFDFIVKLKSGTTQSIKRSQDEPSILTNLKYIPQNYLSELAEKKFKKSNELNKLVRELILENNDSNNEYSYFLIKVKQYDKQIENLVNGYFDIKNDVNNLKNTLIAKGNKSSIKQNIDNSTLEINKLKKEAGFNENEDQKFDKLKENNRLLAIEKSDIVNDWNNARKFNSELSPIINDLITRKKLYLSSLKDKEIIEYYSKNYAFLDDFKALLDKLDRDFVLNDKKKLVNESIFSRKYNSIDKKHQDNILELKPFNLKVETQNKIETIQKSQTEEEKKLNDIRNIEKEIKLKEIALENEKEKIFTLYENNFKEYESIIVNLESRINTLEDENLKIKGITRFNFNKFKEVILDISNSTSKSYNGFKIFEKDNSSTLNFKEIIEEKKEIFNKISSNQYVLRKKTTNKEAIKHLLTDRYFDYWEVSSNNDTLYKMSTGKASFIILKLIIGLSKSEAPILIDQPEDNLDNRSITKELVKYLKLKKEERQIILVTHNPNIVVNADAENVIVAHQYGQNNNEREFDYKFDYINGPLENTYSRKNTLNILESMGIREHVAEIVEGGKEAFKQRELRYRFR